MSSQPAPVIGIDLGTTFSVVASLERSGMPQTILNAEGDLSTPSAVYFEQDQVVVGKEAVKAAVYEPESVLQHVKREMGKPFCDKPIRGTRLPPEVVQAAILRKLRQDAEHRLGNVQDAVITVPAFFNEPRRKATMDAGRLAGLKVLDIINEPTAAAIAYGVQAGFVSASGEARQAEKILVYDLGGGTFDLTLMEIDGRDFRAAAVAGDVYLGGMDWDERIARHVAEAFLRQHGVDLHQQSGEWERLMHAACDAKLSLTARTETPIAFSHAGKQLRLRLTRDEFESLTGDLLERTRLTCRSLLQDAGVQWSDLTRLLLVGGATRMPMVQRMLAEESGLTPDRSLSPDEAVAHGAAIYAGLLLRQGPEGLRGLSVRNVNSHTLGVLGIDPETRLTRRRVMIPRNTPLPASITRKFQTSKDGQKDVMIPVVEGGTDTGEGCTHIGRLAVTDLPPDLPVGTPVKVAFLYGQDGRLTVQATLPAAGREAQLTLERASGMSDEEFQTWAERLRCGLAFPGGPLGSIALDDDGPIDLDETQLAELDLPDDAI